MMHSIERRRVDVTAIKTARLEIIVDAVLFLEVQITFYHVPYLHPTSG